MASGCRNGDFLTSNLGGGITEMMRLGFVQPKDKPVTGLEKG
jgi:hypothetical protein